MNTCRIYLKASVILHTCEEMFTMVVSANNYIKHTKYNQPLRLTQPAHPCWVGKSRLACLVGVKAGPGHVYLCQVAGSTLMWHVTSAG